MFKLHPLHLAVLLVCNAAHADDPMIQRVLVEGSRNSQLGLVDSASAGSIDQKALAARTVYRPGDVIEAVPGLVVSQHSGEGKANQFYLRGFNLDHGTDLATFVDDMPVNQRSHAHGQGWTDLNFLMPELVSKLDYQKGPYSARSGDFASAGAAQVGYVNRLVRDVFSVTAGQDGFGRVALAGSPQLGTGTLLYAIEVMHNDGPFTNAQDFRKANAVLRYSQGYANNGWSVTAMGYQSSWNATDQIPERAVDSGALGRFDAVDPTDGGATKRFSLSSVWRRTDAESASKVSAYIVRNQLALYSNFTYYLDDPVNGDQFAQPDRRVTTGFNAGHTWHRHLGERSSDWTVGAEVQNDNIFNGLYSTRARQTISTTRADHILETSASLYLENLTRWADWLRTTAGVRTNQYRFDVQSSLAANTGSTRDHITSPSLNIALGPWRATELYANIGNGFHSNDARGTNTTIDPKTGDATARVPGLVRAQGMELGLRTEIVPKMQTAVSLYRLDFDSELTFVGDAGTTEAGRPSRRTGIEVSNYYKAARWLSIDVDAAFSRARSRDRDPAGQHIPGAVEGVGQLAFTVDKVGPWSGALRLRYFGPRPLIEDNAVRSHASLTFNGRIGYKWSNDVRIELEGFNLTDRRDSAIDYYYASRLKGEALAVEDIHFHPIERRSLRLTLMRNF
ncbi:TonB-dependent receptor [Massilia sp. S19_KUP03_FR1]|uniref:TonB-dependent receptor n=1 Tax=Massilia sp. S19_KUP03_FR1 TaxID=3025503 RepID=UPI002FCD8080